MTQKRDKISDDRSKDYLENALIHYLDFLSQVSLLTQEEEVHLTTTLADRDNNQEERKKARDQLVEANLRLVLNIAKQYRHMGIPFTDLISEGTIGLMTAIDKFKPELGHRLSTYATWWIRQRILRYIISNQSIIRVPEHIIDKINKLRKEIEKYRQRIGREPTTTELAEQSGLSEEDILKYASAVPYVMSLESGFEHSDGREVQESVQPIADRIPSGNELFLRTLDELTVRSLLRVLDEKERFVICRRFGLVVDSEDNTASDESSTLESLALERGVSRERIRQIEREALRKMKRAYQGSGRGASSSHKR